MATYASISHNFTPPSATTSAQVGAGAMTLIKSVDASSDATISFVHGTSDVVFDSTYKTYIFKFMNMHGSQEGSSGNYSFDFGGRDGSTAYDAIKTSTFSPLRALFTLRIPLRAPQAKILLYWGQCSIELIA